MNSEQKMLKKSRKIVKKIFFFLKYNEHRQINQDFPENVRGRKTTGG